MTYLTLKLNQWQRTDRTDIDLPDTRTKPMTQEKIKQTLTYLTLELSLWQRKDKTDIDLPDTRIKPMTKKR